VRIGLPGRPGDPPVRIVMRFAWIVALIVSIAATGHLRRGDVTVPLLAVAAAAWYGWASALAEGRLRRAAVSLVVLAASGAVVALWSSVAVGFLAAADRKSTRLNSSHMPKSRMPSSA